MREIYLTFALWTSGISIGMWVLAALVALAGVTSSMDPVKGARSPQPCSGLPSSQARPRA